MRQASVLVIFLIALHLVCGTFESTNNEWTYMTQVGQSTYQSINSPGNFGSDKGEYSASLTTVSGQYFVSGNNYYCYRMNFSIPANSALGYQYAYASFPYKSHTTTVTTNTSTWGTLMSLFLRSTASVPVEVWAYGPSKAACKWTTQPTSSWTNFKLAKSSCTVPSGKTAINWGSVVHVDVNIPSVSAGTLELCLVSFTSDTTILTSLPVLGSASTPTPTPSVSSSVSLSPSKAASASPSPAPASQTPSPSKIPAASQTPSPSPSSGTTFSDQYKAENTEWTFMTYTGQVGYSKLDGPKLCGSDVNELANPGGSSYNDSFIVTNDGYNTYSLNYCVKVNSGLGYQYVYSSHTFQSKLNSTNVDLTPSQGGYFSFYARNSLAIPSLRVSLYDAPVGSAARAKAYWTVSLPASTAWTNYKLPLASLTQDAGFVLTQVMEVSFTISTIQCGSLELALMSFTSNPAVYASVPILNEHDFFRNLPPGPAPQATPLPRSSIARPPVTKFGSAAPAAPPSGTKSRLAVLITNTNSGWLGLIHGLKSAGIPFYATQNVNEALTYNSVFVYPTIPSSISTTLMNNYVTSGGTLFTCGFASTALFNLFGGGTGFTNSKVWGKLTFNMAVPGPHSIFTLPEEQWLSLWMEWDNVGYRVTAIQGAPSNKVIAQLWKRTGGTGGTDALDSTVAAMTGQSYPSGGSAYLIGIDLGALIADAQNNAIGQMTVAYSNMYYPGYDLFLHFIENALYKRAGLGFVSLAPIPYNNGLAVMLSHDMDSEESYPNSVNNYTVVELAKGVGATYTIQTKTTKDAYDLPFIEFSKDWVNEIERRGFELASHSESHSPNFDDFPLGTGQEQFVYGNMNGYSPIISCDGPQPDSACYPANIDPLKTCDYYYFTNGGVKQTPGQYDPGRCGLYHTGNNGTVMGELRVSKYLVEKMSVTGQTCVTFRPGHLLYPPTLNEALAATGYKYSSINEANMVISHLPFQLFYGMQSINDVDVFEFPISLDDLSGPPMDDNYTPPNATFPLGSMLYLGVDTAKKTARFGGICPILIHPAAGNGNWETKLAWESAFIDRVRAQAATYFPSIGDFGKFWAARDKVGVDYIISGNTATVTVNAPDHVEGLTLRVPTSWTYVSSVPNVPVTFNALVTHHPDAPVATAVINSLDGVVQLTFSISS